MPDTNRLVTFVFMIILCTSWFGCTGTEEEDNSSQPVTTVILIRHVERDNFFIVTPAGHERAKALKEAVSDKNIAAIYSPELERDLDTVRPLADYLNIEITLIPRLSEKTIDKIVSDILSRHRGETALIVGNGSGNLRALHQRLGGKGEGPYQYGEMFLYTIPDHGPVEVKKLRYGL